MRAHLFRAAISLCAGALLAAVSLLLIYGLDAAIGWNASEWLLFELGKWPVLGSLAKWTGDSNWHPLFLWLAGALIAWPVARRAAFFAEGRPDSVILRPLEFAAINMAPMPWVEAPPPPSEGGEDATRGPHGYRSWHDQRRAMEHLLRWAEKGSGNGMWGRLWPRRPDQRRQPSWQPVAVALVTGVNGIGKSSLAAELGRRMRQGWPPPEHPGGTGWRLAVARWRRAALPGLERLPGDPWHVGALQPADAQVREQLKSWEPSRPTLLVLDEPAASAQEALELLEGRRMVFWHPVRVLVIDQHFPSELYALWPKPGRPAPALPLEHGASLQLGDLRFDGTAVRAMWGALSQQMEAASGVAEADWQRRRSKLWPSHAPGVVAQVADGNPLNVALALAALASTDADLSRWVSEAPVDDPQVPDVERASPTQALQFRALRERLLNERAADLADGHARLLRDRAPGIAEELHRQLVLAAWLGGTTLPEAIAARLPAGLIRDLFPHNPPVGPTRWLPPPRPAAIARAYVRQWLQDFDDQDTAAREMARLAWAQQPERALRTALAAVSPDPRLALALQAVPREAAFRLPWAQGCVGALLYRYAEPPALQPALAALDNAEHEALARWLRMCLSVARPQPIADPSAALQVMLVVDAQTLRRGMTLCWDDTLAAHKYWAQAVGPRAHARRSVRRALATAVGQFLSSWLACASTSDFDHDGCRQWAEELLPFAEGRDAARVAWRVLRKTAHGPVLGPAVQTDCSARTLARARHVAFLAAVGAKLGGQRGLVVAQSHALEVDGIAIVEPGLTDADFQESRAQAWRCAADAACLLGGDRALAETLRLAATVEQIATAQPDFAAHAGIQEERAQAWRYAAYAAGQLGGERALAEALRLAATVEQIATAQPDFATHAGIQKERAQAWRYAAYAAGLLGGERALAEVLLLVATVEQIATAQPDVAAHARIQDERVQAWGYAAYAASQLGGDRALAETLRLAATVEQIATAQPDFEAHARIQAERAQAWRCAADAACLLGGDRALAEALRLAATVEQIATAQPDFAAHARIQEERALALGCAVHAASRLGGESALAEALRLAATVEQIATAQPDFAAHAGIQAARAHAWRYAAYAAGQLGGERALAEALRLAATVEQIATAQPDFAAHAGIQGGRVQAWRYAAYAACRLGGERALAEVLRLVATVEQIAIAHPDFAAHAGIQEERVQAWGYAVYAASQLGGDRALAETLRLAAIVEQISTAQPDFAAHARIQEERALALGCAVDAASRLGGERALAEALRLAATVEQIATAQPDFAAHAGIQAARAQAWAKVAWAGHLWRTDSGQASLLEAAQKVRAIATQAGWSSHDKIQHEWRYVQSCLREDGLRWL